MNRATYNRPKVAIGGHKAAKLSETYYRASSMGLKTKDVKTAAAWKQAGYIVQTVTVSPF